MGTRLNWTRTGLALVCETSTRAIPKTTPAPTEVPDFSRVTSPLVALTLETIPGTTRKGIRVRNIGAEDLPAGKSWTLWWAAYDTAPAVIPWEAIPLGQVSRVDYLLTDPRPTSTHAFRLSDGTVTYPTVTVTTPADTIVGDVANAETLARQSGNLIKNGNSEMANPTGYEAAGISTVNPRAGSKCRQFSGGSAALQLTPHIPCSEGEVFHVEAWGLCSAASDSALIIYASFFNASGGEIQYTGSTGALDWNSYKYIYASETAPSGAVSVCFAVRGGTPGVTYWLDDFYAERKQRSALDAVAAASAAQTTANNAQTAANTANAVLANIASDDVLSAGEKGAVIQDYNVLTSEQAGIDAQATAYGVSRTAYDNAISALTSYLGGLSPAWNNASVDTPIIGSTFRVKFADCYTTRQAVLNAIYAAAKALADAAQSTGDQINSPNYLSNAAKIALRQQWDAEAYQQAQLNTQASAAGVSSSAYGNAISALSTALVSAGAPANWATTWPNGTTSGPWSGIVTTIRDAWSTIAQERVKLQNAIAAADATAKANSAQTSAVTTAANDALSKMNSAILQAQLHQVAFASSALPALPNASYPAGYLAQTTDNRKYQVNAGGTAWGEITQAAVGIFGQIVAAQLTVVNFDNLIPNPTSEMGAAAAGMNPEGNGLVNNTARTGNWCRSLTSGYDLILSRDIPCSPGDMFLFSGYAVCNKSADSNLAVKMLFKNAAGAAVYYPGAPINLDWNDYRPFSVSFVAPTGASTVQFLVSAPTGSGVTYWLDDLYARRMADASLIVDGAILAKIQAGDVIATSNFAAHTGGTNYTYSTIGSTNPATVDSGALLRNGGSGIPSFLIGPSGMQVGSTLIGEALLRSLSMFGNNGGSVSGGTWLGWYLGNVTARNESGTDYYTPDTTCLKITSRWFGTANGTQCGQWDLVLQPTAANSNLDGIRRVEMELYVSGTTTAYRTLYVDITDRGYESTTHSNTGNAIRQTATLVHGGAGYVPESANSYQGYIRARVVGANGPGKWLWYSPASNGTEITGSTTTPSAVTGAPGSGGGSSGDGGGKVLDPII